MNFSEMTRDELRKLAAEANIRGRSKMTKAELIEALEYTHIGESKPQETKTKPTETKALAEDTTVPAGMFDPELTYYADGTRVVMRARGEEKFGVAAGMTVNGSPYQFQVVRFDDGTTEHVAPHVLHAVSEPKPQDTNVNALVTRDAPGMGYVNLDTTKINTAVLVRIGKRWELRAMTGAPENIRARSITKAVKAWAKRLGIMLDGIETVKQF